LPLAGGTEAQNMPSRQIDNIGLLVLSDLHAGPGNQYADLRTNDSAAIVEGEYFQLKHLAAEAASLLKNVSVARRFVVCPGDLSSKCNSLELRGAIRGLLSIADALKIPPENCFLVPGNHEIDWNLTRLRGEDEWYFGYRQEKFRRTVEDLGFDARACSEGTPKRLARLNGLLEFYLLDSVHNDSSEAQPHHGKLDHEQMNRLEQLLKESQPDALRIAVLHHHVTALGRGVEDPDYSLLTDAADLKAVVEKGNIHFIIHGHQHRPAIEVIVVGSRPVTVLASGSATIPTDKLPVQVRHAFHVVRIDEITSDGPAGMIETRVLKATGGWVPPLEAVDGVPPQYFFGRILSPEKKDELAARAIDSCGQNSFAKLRKILDDDPEGERWNDTDFRHHIEAVLRKRGTISAYEFTLNEQTGFYQMSKS
jgi:3',5'-cyclic AMP phosphodiesterase CpdA